MEIAEKSYPADFTKILEQAFAFDIRMVVKRYMNKRGVTKERSQRIANEMLKYLCLCADDPSHDWIIMGEIDEMWHTFVLFTEKYSKFCNSVFGRFIHHVPGEEGRERDRVAGLVRDGAVAVGYSQTLQGYSEKFGYEPDPSIWPTPSLSLIEIGQEPRPCGACGGGGPEPACGCSRPKTCYPGGRP